MSEEQTPENQAQPEAEEESAQILDFSSVTASQAALSGNYSFDELFADGDTIDDSDTNHWSVPWADLMMVMFVLFAALLTAQALERKVPEPVEQPVPNIEVEKEKVVRDTMGTGQLSFEPLMRVNVFERSRQAVREANIQNVEIAIMEDQSVKVSVQGPMFFELGKADLRKEVRDFLKNLSRVINQTPYQVNIIGHTDDYPINTAQFPSNWELSVTRAARAARYMIDEGAVDPRRVTVMGRAQYEPVTANTSARERSLNRRVEIIITREVSDPAEGVLP
jgi:chemotaxis protein MotB